MDFRDTGREAGEGNMADMLEAEKTETETPQAKKVKPEKEVVEANAKASTDSKSVAARRFNVVTDASRDDRLTEFGKETFRDRYLLPGESYQDLFAHVADAFADDQDHAQRLYDYISKL